MLVAAPERWDEVCFAVPAVRAMIASGLEVGIFCPEIQCRFWETLEGITVIAFPPKVKSNQLTLEIRGNWEASLAWECGIAAESFKLAKIPRRLGQNDRKLAKFLTHPLTITVGPLEHRVRYYLAAVESLGMETAKPEFFAPMATTIGPATETVLVCPDSDFGPSHEWPIERWLEISDKLIEIGYHLVIADIDGARGLAHTLAGCLGEHATIFSAMPFSGALPGLAAYPFVIAADGSLPHIASHAGATCFVLFGPNDPVWKRPLGKRHTIIRRHVECAPCLLAKCPMDMRCQKELDVQRVWAAIQNKLG